MHEPRRFGHVTEAEERRKENILPFGRTCGREMLGIASPGLGSLTKMRSVSAGGFHSELSVASCLVSVPCGPECAF